MSLSYKQKAFVREYVKDWNGAQAAIRAGYSKRSAYSIAQENLTKPEIRQAIDETIMTAEEAASNIAEIAHGDMGQFFRLVEEWTFYPLPTYEILGEKEVFVLDDDGKPTEQKKVSYWVRHIVLDMDKVIDPRYSRPIHKFTDSPKNGLGIELYDRHDANRDILKYRGKIIDKTDITTNGHELNTPVSDEERVDRIATLLDEARARRDRQADSGS